MPMKAAPMTSATMLTMVMDEPTLTAPDVLVDLAAEVVALAVPVEVTEALAVVVTMLPTAALVVATVAAVVEATRAVPAMAADSVALKVPVMPERVNLAEYEV